MNPRVAVAGALLAALCGVGLWTLQKDTSAPRSRPAPRPAPAVSPAQPLDKPSVRLEAQGTTTPPRAELPPEGVLAVEVLSGDSPLPGAQLQLYWRESREVPTPPARWSAVGQGETDGSGRWDLPARPGSYFIAARAQGFAPGTLGVVHPPGGARTAVRLRLEAGVALPGHTVMQGAGEPISLAEIVLTPLAFPPGLQGHLDAPEEELHLTTSNEGGEFRFTGLAPGRYRAEARAPGFVRKVLPSVPVPFGARLTLALLPGGRLDGVVVGRDGQPVAGAEVLAFNSSHDATGFTDAQGGFALEVPPGSYSVSARHESGAGTRPQEVAVAAEQVVRGLRLKLGAGARVSGRVLWEDGTAAFGARVEARTRGARVPSGQTGTDESGAFSLSSLAAGTYDVGIFMPQGGWLAREGLTLADGEHVTLMLTFKSRGGLRVRAQDLKARPLPGARVSARALQGAGKVHEGQTDAQGSLHLAELMPGPYQVEARYGPSAPSSEQAVTVLENGVREVLFRLPGPEDAPAQASTVQGRVVERSGAAPPAPVRLEVLMQATRPILLRTVLTDAQGRFQLVLSPGKYTLAARRQHRVRCEADGQLPLLLEAARPLETTLVLEEPRAPGWKVRVEQADGAPLRLTPVTVSFRGGDDSGRTDAEGRLEVCAGPTPSPEAPLLLQALEPRRAALVTRHSGQRELTARLRPLPTLRGRVTHMSGATVRRFHLEWSSTDFALSPLAHDFLGEQFELREVPPGRGQLLATVDDGRRALVPIDLSPGEDRRLELPVHSGVPLTGRLVDATTGAPLAEVEVSLPLFAHTRTSRDGRFTIRDLPPGEHLLQLSRGATKLSRSVTLVPGQAHDLGDIALDPPG